MARTTAPRLPAAPIAASPATPAPATSTFAGGTLPAAVTWPVKNRPNSCAASITARYPAILAIEESTSKDCAREIRGTASRDSAVMGRSARSSTRSGLNRGSSRPISVAPGRRASSRSGEGGATPSTTSAAAASPIAAPASSYRSSGKPAPAPAPDSTITSYPSFCSLVTVSGVAATRRSPGESSLRTPTIMTTTSYLSRISAGSAQYVASRRVAGGARPPARSWTSGHRQVSRHQGNSARSGTGSAMYCVPVLAAKVGHLRTVLREHRGPVRRRKADHRHSRRRARYHSDPADTGGAQQRHAPSPRPRARILSIYPGATPRR
ncbi:Uncharacterised protein [Mycobacterium tuberculosis]|nr:Uncharacterised protein [Mycobacterium tuberculosis]